MRTIDVETAKKLAERLRSDPNDAGHEIPHSLALELIAHQSGARNVVAARGCHGPGEEQFVDVETEVLTVRQLRELLSGVPDDAEVHSVHPVDARGESAIRLPATGGFSHDGRFTLIADTSSGRHSVPARRSFALRYPEGADVETVREAVGAAVEAVRGGAGVSYSRDDDSRTCTWTGTSANTPLDVIVTAATRAFASLSTPGWRWSTNRTASSSPNRTGGSPRSSERSAVAERAFSLARWPTPPHHGRDG